MPVFAYTLANLEANGATLEVNIFPPFPVITVLQSEKKTIPSRKLIGLIDTGASCTAFSAPIAVDLGLIARDKQIVYTPSGESEHPLYDIVISLANTSIGIPIQAFGAILDKQPYHIILGRDVLRSCTLIYDGWNNSYDLHLHQEKIKII
jgi:hypothetical protein